MAAFMVGMTGAHASKDVNFRYDAKTAIAEAPAKDQIQKFQYNDKYEPVFFIKDDVLYVSYLNFDKKEVNFKFKDNEYHNTVIFRHSSYDENLQKAFALDNLTSGNYTLVVTIDDKEYNYEFTRG